MRLKTVEQGSALRQKLMLGMMRFAIGVRVPDVLRIIVHRPEFFGQRELFAAFTSHLNQCQYCLGPHKATSIRSLRDEHLVQAVLEDWQTAPIDEKTKVMLGFLRKL